MIFTLSSLFVWGILHSSAQKKLQNENIYDMTIGMIKDARKWFIEEDDKLINDGKGFQNVDHFLQSVDDSMGNSTVLPIQNWIQITVKAVRYFPMFQNYLNICRQISNPISLKQNYKKAPQPAGKKSNFWQK